MRRISERGLSSAVIRGWQVSHGSVLATSWCRAVQFRRLQRPVPPGAKPDPRICVLSCLRRERLRRLDLPSSRRDHQTRRRSGPCASAYLAWLSKAGTADVGENPAVHLIKRLVAKGRCVRVVDPRQRSKRTTLPSALSTYSRETYSRERDVTRVARHDDSGNTKKN
jgi:hypothetical protein